MTFHYCRFAKSRLSFRPLVAKLFSSRYEYVHLADLLPYIDAQERVDIEYRDRTAWLKKSLLNIARMGKFSSDRTIRQYATEIWRIKPAVIGSSRTRRCWKSN